MLFTRRLAEIERYPIDCIGHGPLGQQSVFVGFTMMVTTVCLACDEDISLSGTVSDSVGGEAFRCVIQ